MPNDSADALRHLLDRTAIRVCVSAYASAVDRHDEARIAAVFHPDAIDDHGRYVGGVDGFVGWVNQVHEANETGHAHNVTTHNCEVDGDIAHAESYIIWALRHRHTSKVLFGSGRYLDRLERRDGQWRIMLRRVVREMRFECPAFPLQALSPGFPIGRWDRQDLVYAHLSEERLPVAADGAGEPRKKLDPAIIQRLVERLAVRDCIALSARAADRGDEALARRIATPGPAATILGNDDAHSPEGRWTHNLSTHVSRIDGAFAAATSRLLHVVQDKGGSIIVSSEMLEDRLRNDEGGWRIEGRIRTPIWRRRVDGIALNADDGPQLSRRDRSDLSYQRPLAIAKG